MSFSVSWSENYRLRHAKIFVSKFLFELFIGYVETTIIPMPIFAFWSPVDTVGMVGFFLLPNNLKMFPLLSLSFRPHLKLGPRQKVQPIIKLNTKQLCATCI